MAEKKKIKKEVEMTKIEVEKLACMKAEREAMRLTIRNQEYEIQEKCKELEEIIIHDKVLTIGNSAFEECKKLKRIVLPKHLHHLNENAFSVQFHPEACGGPKDTEFLFDEFMKMMGR